MSKRVVFWNSVSGVTLLAADAVLAFVMTPIIVAALGNRDYSLWEIMLGIVGYLGILDVAVGPGIIRYVALAQGRGDLESVRRIFNTGFVVMASAGSVTALVMLTLGQWGEDILGLNSGELPVAQLLFGGFALNLLGAFLVGSFACFLMGLQQHWYVNLVRASCAVLQAGGVLWILMSDKEPALLWMVGLLVIIWMLQFVAFAIRAASFGGKLQFRHLNVDFVAARDLFTFGLKSGLLMAATTLVRRAALIVIAHVISVASVVFFVIPNRLAEYGQSLGMALGFPLTPYFAAISGKGGLNATRDVWVPTTRVLQVFTLGVPVGVAALGGPFIATWMGAEYAELGAPILWILCAGLFAQGIACNCNRVLVSQAAHGRAAMFTAVASVIAVIASILLAQRFGLIGIAAAVTLFMCAQAAIEMRLACRLIGMKVSDYLSVTAFRYSIPVLTLIIVLTGLQAVSPPHGYWGIVWQAAVAGILYVGTVARFSLSREERSRVWGLLKSASQALGGARQTASPASRSSE
jgi:O-antigen/teichoic acid export membrane protein